MKYTEMQIYVEYQNKVANAGYSPMTMEAFNEELNKKIRDIRQSGGKQSSKMKLAKIIANTQIRGGNIKPKKIKKDKYTLYRETYEKFRNQAKKYDKNYKPQKDFDSRVAFERFLRGIEKVTEASIRKHAMEHVFEYSDRQARHYKERIDHFKAEHPELKIPNYTLTEYKMYGGSIVEEHLAEVGMSVSGSQLWGSN